MLNSCCRFLLFITYTCTVIAILSGYCYSHLLSFTLTILLIVLHIKLDNSGHLLHKYVLIYFQIKFVNKGLIIWFFNTRSCYILNCKSSLNMGYQQNDLLVTSLFNSKK